MIYLDNASTTYIKPQSVYEAVYHSMKHGLGNPGRGANSVSMAAGRIIEDCRSEIHQFFNAREEDHVILKSSVTDAINTLLFGLLRPGDHVISSVMEHNSVLRPLECFRKKGLITYDLLSCDGDGKVSLNELPSLERDNTRVIILSHVSNLTGTIQPIQKIRSKLTNKNIFIIVDTAQSAGYIKVDMHNLDVDALAFTGHKGLMGPQGTGGFLLNQRMNLEMTPVFTGGTGSDSLSLDQPLYLPDKFEAGTANLPGFAGLYEGVSYINEISIDIITDKLTALSDYFLKGIAGLNSIRIMGFLHSHGRIPNFSLLFDGVDCSEAAFILEREYDIITRSGYHCAPLAHKALGTEGTGSLRISFGHFTTYEEIDAVLIGLHYLNEVNYAR